MEWKGEQMGKVDSTKGESSPQGNYRDGNERINPYKVVKNFNYKDEIMGTWSWDL